MIAKQRNSELPADVARIAIASCLYLEPRFHYSVLWHQRLSQFLGRMNSTRITGWTLAGVTIRQEGSPLNITNGNAGSIFCGGSCTAFTPSGQFVTGMGPSNVLAGGTLTQRVIDGLRNNAGEATGTPGYFNSGVFLGSAAHVCIRRISLDRCRNCLWQC